MPKYSDLTGLPVLCADEGRVAGRVTGALIDGGRRAAACLLVDMGAWYLGVQALPFDRITGVSAIAVMTSGVRELRPVADDERLVRIAQAGAQIEGLDVYTPQGDLLGKASDYSVDASGAIQSVFVEGGQEIPIRYIQAVGPDAIIAEFEYDVVRLDVPRDTPPPRETPKIEAPPPREAPPLRETPKIEAPPPREAPLPREALKAEPAPRAEQQRAPQQVQVPGGSGVTVRANIPASSAQGVQFQVAGNR